MTEKNSPTLYQRNDAVLWRRVLDGLVLNPPGHDQVVHFGAPMAIVWSCLEHPVSVDQLADELVKIFDVTVDVVRSDMESVMADLADLGAVTSVN